MFLFSRVQLALSRTKLNTLQSPICLNVLRMCVCPSDVPVHCAMPQPLSKARLQAGPHQQHGRLQTPGQKGKAQRRGIPLAAGGLQLFFGSVRGFEPDLLPALDLKGKVFPNFKLSLNSWAVFAPPPKCFFSSCPWKNLQTHCDWCSCKLLCPPAFVLTHSPLGKKKKSSHFKTSRTKSAFCWGFVPLNVFLVGAASSGSG